jgi:hypothetical protein
MCKLNPHRGIFLPVRTSIPMQMTAVVEKGLRLVSSSFKQAMELLEDTSVTLNHVIRFTVLVLWRHCSFEELPMLP